MPDFRDRRSVLRAGAALCTLSLAGCLEDGDDGGDDSDGDGTQPGDTDGNGTDSDGTDADGNATDGTPPDDPDWETIEEWPQLQYDVHNTGYVHAKAPTDVEELWNVELDDDGVIASPVVADGTVYVRTPPGTVHAIEEGDVVWETELSLHRMTEGTPVIYDDLLVVPVEGGLVGL